MRELNADRHSAMTTSADGWPCSDLGYDNWMLQHILPTLLPLEGSPVTLAERALAVRLPESLSVPEFDKRLHLRMRNAALNPWLNSAPDGPTAHISGSRRPHACAQPATASARSCGSAAQEFYFFRPKSRDADRLLRITEAIIHDTSRTATRAPAPPRSPGGKGTGRGLNLRP